VNRAFDPTNHLFQLARTGKRRTHIAVMIFITFTIVSLSPFAETPLVAGLRTLNAPPLLVEMAGLTAPFGLYILLLTIWLRLYEKRPLWTTGLEQQGALQKFFRGVFIAVLTFSGVVGMLVVLGYIRVNFGSAVTSGPSALPGVLAIFFAWSIQGSAEEILYRGWLLPTLAVRYRPIIGLSISSLLFMLAHGLGPGFGPLAAINLLLFALFAVLYALYEESLWGIAGWHAGWNWTQGNLYGLQVSGYEIGSSLVNLDTTQPDWVSGGTFGPEGGIIVSIALALGVVALITASRR
jgi:uncharacterized protein